MNKEIEQHGSNLYQFIDIATRYKIEALYKLRTPNRLFPIVESYVDNRIDYYYAFRTALRTEIDKPENGRAFEIDIKDSFLPMINHYYQWYETHKEETKIFEPYNFYDWMFGVMVSTEHEINKYYVKDLKLPRQKENNFENTNLRRSVAFCVCLLYKAGKYDLKKMTKENLQEFISINFEGISAQRVLNSLLGYDVRFTKELPMFYYGGSWTFKEANFECMKKKYLDDFKNGEELFNKLK